MIYNHKFARFQLKNLIPAIKTFKSYPIVDTGIVYFCGSQGSGKTTSLCAYLQVLCDLYGKDNIKVYSELPLLSWFDGSQIDYYPFSVDLLVNQAFEEHKLNIICLDEISVLFNSLESAKLPITIPNSLCQLRKQKILILATCQVYSRVSKQFREQATLTILCSKKWIFQHNLVYDMATEGFTENLDFGSAKPIVNYLFIPHDEYNMFDTAYKITRKKVRK